MFLEISEKSVFQSEASKTLIEPLHEAIYLNLNQLIQIEFNECFIKKIHSNTSIVFIREIKLYIISEDGIWNYMTLYFTKESNVQFQRIKNIVIKGDNYGK